MKSVIKRMLPGRAIEIARTARAASQLRHEFALDRKRYARHAAPADHRASLQLTGRNVETQLTKDYHRIEKGLALANPKKPFGLDVASRLDMLIPHARSAEPDADYLANAVSARTALSEWNDGGKLDGRISPLRLALHRGVSDPEAFFTSRHSVRDYADTTVELALLERATALAINTPSVCNRQSWRVRYYRDSDVSRVLAFQNGNIGFTQSVPVVAVVTVDVRLFAAEGERNQPWIEGGLFSMSLALALHSLDLDSCMLNMSQQNGQIDELRREVGIPDHELVIMMMAIGYGNEGHRRARSPRRALDDVIEL